MVTTAGSGGGRATSTPRSPLLLRGSQSRLHPTQCLHPWVLHSDHGWCWVEVGQDPWLLGVGTVLPRVPPSWAGDPDILSPRTLLSTQ